MPQSFYYPNEHAQLWADVPVYLSDADVLWIWPSSRIWNSVYVKEETVSGWIGYVGSPVHMEELILKPEHSLIDQSLGQGRRRDDQWRCTWRGLVRRYTRPRLTNQPNPRGTTATSPNCRNTSVRTCSWRMFRVGPQARPAAANCHPFCHKQWMLVRNGVIRDYHRVQHDLAFAVHPRLCSPVSKAQDRLRVDVGCLRSVVRPEPPGANDGFQ